MKNLVPLAFLLFFFGCDGPYNNCDEYYFSEEYKSYVFFKVGSYWIYEDTIHNIIDSCSLYEATYKFIDFCDYNTESEEVLRHIMYSSYYPGTHYYTYNGHASQQDYQSYGIYPMGYYSDYGHTEILDSLEIRDTWYWNVKKFEIGENKFYYAKNIGLIKKVLPYPEKNDSLTIFELIKYDLK